MLTLNALRPNEPLIIGDEVEIIILSVTGNQVRVGINAPANVAIHREEIYERIQRELSVTPRS